MAHIIAPPAWRLSEREAAPESLWLNRREFVKRLGLGAVAIGTSGCGSDGVGPPGIDPARHEGCNAEFPRSPAQMVCPAPNQDLYPAARVDAFPVPYGSETLEGYVVSYNNYYEFIGFQGDVKDVWGFTGPLEVWPWTVEVRGEAEVTGVFDLAALEREFGLEERVYRLRCVEAWSIVVPWTGFPLAKLISKFRPLSSANYVRFISFHRPSEAVGQRNQPWYPWPFYEGLRMDEALHELAFVATGAYGHPLPKQNGAPWRLAIPWKYGFKSSKAISRIEFVRDQPRTFWSDVWPEAYGFYSNVNPAVAHPDWSQEYETPLTPDEAPVLTQVFNGYAPYVWKLYDPDLMTYRS